ncbi:MAG: hypothetical protein E7414_02100 [Ruminococcaceae bacterium]|nr:hypothetical protein [Oscillospiraceae bacterium]
MNLYIGADLETSALKLMLIGADSEIIKTVTKEYSVMYPKSGWSEKKPEDWWDTGAVWTQLLLK